MQAMAFATQPLSAMTAPYGTMPASSQNQAGAMYMAPGMVAMMPMPSMGCQQTQPMGGQQMQPMGGQQMAGQQMRPMAGQQMQAMAGQQMQPMTAQQMQPMTAQQGSQQVQSLGCQQLQQTMGGQQMQQTMIGQQMQQMGQQMQPMSGQQMFPMQFQSQMQEMVACSMMPGQQQQPQDDSSPRCAMVQSPQQMQQMGSVVFVPVMMPVNAMTMPEQMPRQQMTPPSSPPPVCSSPSWESSGVSPAMLATSFRDGGSCFMSVFSTSTAELSSASPVSSASSESKPISEDAVADHAPHSPLCGGRAAIFEELLDCVNRKDLSAMLVHRRRYWSADCETHWVDIGVYLHGLEDLIAQDTKIIRDIDDWSAVLLEVSDRGRGEVEAQIHISGCSPSHNTLPMFPAGQFCQWIATVRTSFNACGQFRRFSVSLGPVPDVGLEPANLQAIAESSLALAMTPSGSRLLQLGIQAAGSDVQESIIAHMWGHIWEVAGSPHGNHALQRYVSTAPASFALLIAAEFRGRVVAAAQHNTRSRVLERLLEHCPPDMMAPLVEELFHSVPMLCRDPFGNFVMQRLFEHSGPEQRHRAAAELAPHACKLARHRQANNAVRAAIAHCAQEDRLLIAGALLSDRRGFASLAKHIAGSFVARELRLAGLVA